MATKKYLELKELTDADLANEIITTEGQYKNLKFDHAIKGLDNPMALKEVRKDIARLKSESRRRELAGMSEEQKAGRSKIVARRK